eukprot:COSAG04_NODE_339_length_16323_cov_3.879315_13_plen_461_part_00
MECGGWRPRQEITTLDSDALRRVPRDEQEGLRRLIDALGEASARAQRLPSVITTFEKLYTSAGQRLYLVAQGGKGLGLLKMGVKKLFVRTASGRTVEMDPLCCLDFYVHESQQRRGMGKRVFEHMLREEGAQPQKIAYDRPSAKLLGFMSKHYRLSSYVSQPNNYVVFDQYFDDRPSSGRGDRSVSQRPLTRDRQKRRRNNGRGGPEDHRGEALATSLEGLGNRLGGGGNARLAPVRRNGSDEPGKQWGGALAPMPQMHQTSGLPFERISISEQNRVPRVPDLKVLRGHGGQAPSGSNRSNEADFTRQMREQQLMSDTDQQVFRGGGGAGAPQTNRSVPGAIGRNNGRAALPRLGGRRGGPSGPLAHGRGGGGGGGEGHQPSFLDRIEQQAEVEARSGKAAPQHFTPDAPPTTRTAPSMPVSFPGNAVGAAPFGRPSFSQPSQPSAVPGVPRSFLSTSLW